MELAAMLSGDGHVVAVLGGEAEADLGDRILEGLPDESRLNLAGRTTLRELMTWISVCDCLVTNDSGPMHIADAVGTPAVAFFGSTDSTWTGPQADHHRILQADEACNPCFLRECPLDLQCMRSLTLDRAASAVREILDRGASLSERA
jgi:heptosyltransferase-2